MKEELSNEIWRSNLHPDYKNSGKILISVGMFFLFIPLIFLLILFFDKDVQSVLNIYIIIQITFSIIAALPILVGAQFFVPYLIVYENGIGFRRTHFLKFLKKHYVPFTEIEGIEIKKSMKYYGSWNLNFGFSVRRERQLSGGYSDLFIFIRGQKPHKVSNAWVYEIETVRDLISGYMKGEKPFLSCFYCRSGKITKRCKYCGQIYCKDCEETVRILSIDVACIMCQYKNMAKRAYYSLIPSFLFLFLYNLYLLIFNPDIFNAPAVGSSYLGTLKIFYIYFNLFLSGTLIPFGLSLIFSNFFRMKRIKSLKISKKKSDLYFSALLGAIIIVFKIVFYILILNTELREAISMVIIDISLIFILCLLFFYLHHIRALKFKY